MPTSNLRTETPQMQLSETNPHLYKISSLFYSLSIFCLARNFQANLFQSPKLGDSVKRFLISSTNLAYCLLPLICAENMHIPITNLKYPVNNCLSSCISELTQNHSVSIKQFPYCQYKPSRESTACSKHNLRTTYAKPRKTNTLQTYQISLPF